MKKNLGVIPTIYERRNNLNIIIEKRVYKFLRECFNDYNIIILDDCHNIKLDLVVSLGGNSLYSLEKNASNLYRMKLDKFYIKKSLKKKIPFLGICHGAQSLSNLFRFKIIKKNGHTNINHKIFYDKNNSKIVNSYHNYSIVKIDKHFLKIAWAIDGDIEAFIHRSFPILGLMWHPERYNKIKAFDKKLIRKYL